MKIILPFLIFSLTFCSLKAQHEFAPIGAKWIQDKGHNDFENEMPLNDFYTFESFGDTVINNLTLRQVNNYLFYQDAYKIYFWFGDSLNLIYDFDVNQGDTIQLSVLNYQEEIVKGDFIISAVDSIIIDGIILKKVLAVNETLITIAEYEYIEKMGSLHKLVYDKSGLFLVGGAFPEYLRCYNDNEINYKTEQFLQYNQENCEYRSVTSTAEILEEQINLYPNPVDECLYIENFLKWNQAKYKMIHLSGQVIDEKYFTKEETKIDVTNLKSGFYFLQIITPDKNIIKPFIKN